MRFTKKHILISVIVLVLIITIISKRKRLKKIAMDSLNFINQKVWDFRSERKIETLHPAIQSKAREFINRAEKQLGIKLRITSALRTFEEQNALYARGRTDLSRGKVTNAKAGQSWHNYGLAFDVVEIKDGKAIWKNPRWNEIGQLGKSLGFSWGGDWKSIVDKPHFQMTFGHSIASALKKFNSGDKKGNYINIA